MALRSGADELNGVFPAINGLSVELAAHMFRDTALAQTESRIRKSPELRVSAETFRKFAVDHFDNLKTNTRRATLSGAGSPLAGYYDQSYELIRNYFAFILDRMEESRDTRKYEESGQLMIDLKEALSVHLQINYFISVQSGSFRNMTWDNWAVEVAAESMVMIEMEKIQANWKYSELWLKDGVATRAAAFPIAVAFLEAINENGISKTLLGS